VPKTIVWAMLKKEKKKNIHARRHKRRKKMHAKEHEEKERKERKK
jgi:hypothetical protein